MAALVAVMTFKKSTPGKHVWQEEDGSPHFDLVGIPMNIYVPQISVRNVLGIAGDPATEAPLVTLMLEPGNQVAAAAS